MLSVQTKLSNECQRCSCVSELCAPATANETGSNIILELPPAYAFHMPYQNDLYLGYRYDPDRLSRTSVSGGSCKTGCSRDHKEHHLLHSGLGQHDADELQEIIFENLPSTTSIEMSSKNEKAENLTVEVQQTTQSSTLCNVYKPTTQSSTASNGTPSNLNETSKSFQSPFKRKQSFSREDDVSNYCKPATGSSSDASNHPSSSSNLDHLTTKKAIKEPLKTLESTNNSFLPPVGPNDFQLTISLSQDPWDMSTQDAEWLYIDKNGEQLPLNLNTSLLLDHIHNSCTQFNSKVRMSLPETGKMYDINFRELEMTDVCTGEKTALLRKSWTPGKPLQAENESFFPTSWSPQNHDIVLVTLDQKTEEHRTIRNTFLRTMPECCVIGIERIQNKKLFIRYSFQKAVLLEKVSGSVEGLNEKMLFHGTSKTPPKKIWQSEDGFDLRYSRRGMWGIGSYFAQNSSYSDNYAYIYSGNYPVFREMIVANVLTGNSIEMQSNNKTRKLTRPPVFTQATQNNPEVLYDSVTGFTGGSRIYVLYKFDMAYPSYLIRYFHLKPG
ncbi:protein mono-ADP-ribosyltransferase PARP12-like [Dendronephthya gigantea]|uniref:protein mono-ADP-ribosyltransferase PARP12-like n=1 Tax=Dendronephthya gigantea TaxID=151771 RepID=UPI001069D7ED|nr:protein mono-ADP-ribosyltransferase PARP12-like [Dendronephthya gigantea]XP_028405177.1 protein mono-ADP-ribosyltransferase PARP12-like [Dendronephthya gigantea]